ncbi:YHYH protein [Aureliella helgolandensis]|uniref:YHYH domain-containing protein n=1 Tax=Aureliella helgolandensis TaxID=2527968 RepID=A0A518G7T4_9BACT|nr:hypothetical protein Q31a_29760 [Aureliella helgolandensis]
MTPTNIHGITHRFLGVAFAIAVSLAAPNILWAHDGPHHGDPEQSTGSRTWTLGDAGAHLHGTFVAASGENIQIRLDGRRLVTLKLERLIASDREWIANRLEAIENLNQQRPVRFVVQQPLNSDKIQAQDKAKPMPSIHEHFLPFSESLKLRWDDEYFYVGSNGIPAHPMMIGIRSWQQQVPIPQKYFGENAWRIPLHPVPAKRPMSTKGNFLRGAIALAVNGVPIFNPLNNRGDDALLFGELDEYGGHCGRADDYHYHIAPVHLETTTGKGQPIAYALDGYPIFGYQDAQATDFAPLDALGGHKDGDGNYHFHATRTYPYLNGGFFGEVVERGGQVDPQPRAEPIRPDLRPLRDAKITEFTQPKPGSYRLVYDVNGKQGSVSYTLADNGSASFVFVDPNGRTKSETYTPRQERPRRGGGPPPPPPPRARNDAP